MQQILPGKGSGWFMDEEDRKLLRELDFLRQERRSVDEQISQVVRATQCDEIALQRMKRQKASLDGRISVIEAIVYPDIIA